MGGLPQGFSCGLLGDSAHLEEHPTALIVLVNPVILEASGEQKEEDNLEQQKESQPPPLHTYISNFNEKIKPAKEE